LTVKVFINLNATPTETLCINVMNVSVLIRMGAEGDKIAQYVSINIESPTFGKEI
jgi:hypothetical protein